MWPVVRGCTAGGGAEAEGDYEQWTEGEGSNRKLQENAQ